MAHKGSFSKKTLLAISKLAELNLEPIELEYEVYKLAMECAQMRMMDKGDSAASFLAVAQKAAADLASYKHPKLSAIAIADATNNQNDERKQLTTQDAINIIKQDHFAPKEVKEIDTEQVLDAMSSAIQTPALPAGLKHE